MGLIRMISYVVTVFILVDYSYMGLIRWNSYMVTVFILVDSSYMGLIRMISLMDTSFIPSIILFIYVGVINDLLYSDLFYHSIAFIKKFHLNGSHQNFTYAVFSSESCSLKLKRVETSQYIFGSLFCLWICCIIV